MAFADEMVGISTTTASGLGGQYLALTALGSTLGTSAPITASMCVVSGADGTKGVVLPQGIPGDECWVYNSSASALIVWPGNANTAIEVPGTGLGTAGSSVQIAARQAALYKLVTTTQWLAIKSTT